MSNLNKMSNTCKMQWKQRITESRTISQTMLKYMVVSKRH